jgi:hypothetical protein
MSSGAFATEDPVSYACAPPKKIWVVAGRGVRIVRPNLHLLAKARGEQPWSPTDRPALLGAATSRAAAQLLRLSLIYALLDGSKIVRPQHLGAAREVWRYCEDSARYLIGEALDSMADRLLVAIRNADEDGLTGTEIRDLFGQHASIEDIKRALAQLDAVGLVVRVREKTAGRPVTRWIAT